MANPDIQTVDHPITRTRVSKQLMNDEFGDDLSELDGSGLFETVQYYFRQWGSHLELVRRDELVDWLLAPPVTIPTAQEIERERQLVAHRQPTSKKKQLVDEMKSLLPQIRNRAVRLYWQHEIQKMETG